MRLLGFAVIAAVLMMATSVFAEIVTKDVEYAHEGTVLEGFLAYDDTMDGKRPGVLVVHEWMGLGEYAKSRAKQLAEMGYVAFAADIYGKGVRAENAQEASQLATKYRSDRQLMRGRANAGLDELKKQNDVDASKTAAIGYCFGGGVVLELARSGADVGGVVSFHGNLDTPNPEDAANIKGQILVCHGAADPHVPMEQVADFVKEMGKVKPHWQLIMYGDAVHSFTNPGSGDDPSSGVAYNEWADKHSWGDMQEFFNDIFK